MHSTAATGEQPPPSSAVDVILHLERLAAGKSEGDTGGAADGILKSYFHDVRAVLDTIEDLQARLPPEVCVPEHLKVCPPRAPDDKGSILKLSFSAQVADKGQQTSAHEEPPAQQLRKASSPPASRGLPPFPSAEPCDQLTSKPQKSTPASTAQMPAPTVEERMQVVPESRPLPLQVLAQLTKDDVGLRQRVESQTQTGKSQSFEKPPPPGLRLSDSFRGSAPRMSDDDRLALHTSTIDWDLAFVLPNPDWDKSDASRPDVFDFHDHFDSCCQCDIRCRRHCLSSLLWTIEKSFSWTTPDLVKRQGVTEADAEVLYMRALRGLKGRRRDILDDFKRAFRCLTEFDGGDALLFQHGARAEPHRQKRCMSHGGTFKRLAANRGDAEESRASRATYAQTCDPDRCCNDFLSLIRNVLVTKISRLGLVAELVFSSDFHYIYVLVGASEDAFKRIAKDCSYSLTVDLAKADADAFEPCDSSYRLYEEHFLVEGKHSPSLMLSSSSDEVHTIRRSLEKLRAERRADIRTQSRELSHRRISDVPADVLTNQKLYRQYLDERIKGLSAIESMAYVNKKAELPPCYNHRLRHLWDWSGMATQLCSLWECLGMTRPVEGVRAQYGGVQLPWKKHAAWTVSGTPCSTSFSRTDRLQLIMRAIADEVDVTFLAQQGYILDVVPVPSDPGAGRDGLKKAALDAWAHPLAHVVAEYGQAVALYFAFIHHLSGCLQYIAGFGFTVQILGALRPDYIAELLFLNSIAVSIWSAYWWNSWKHTEDKLMLQWGVLSVDRASMVENVPTMQFKGVYKRSPVTDKDEEVHPLRLKSLCWLLSMLASLLFAVLQLMLVCLICALRAKIHNYTRIGAINYNYSYNIVTVANAVSILMINPLLRWFAGFCTRLENHRSHTSFMNNYTVKAIILQFVNTFASLFYIAFFMTVAEEHIAEGAMALCEEDLRDGNSIIKRLFWIDSSEFAKGNCMWPLLNQEHAALLVIFMVKNLVELSVPWVQRRLAEQLNGPADQVETGGSHALSRVAPTTSEDIQHRQPDEASVRRNVRNVVKVLDNVMMYPRYGGIVHSDGALEDYSELAVMLGFLLLFSITLPIAGVWVFCCCYLESLVDSFKVQKLVRQPIPALATTIGIWEKIFEGLLWASVATNAALLVWTAKLSDFKFAPELFGESYEGSQGVPWAILCLIFGSTRFLTQVMTRKRRGSLADVDERMAHTLEKLRLHEGSFDLWTGVESEGEKRLPLRTTDFRVRAPEDLGA